MITIINYDNKYNKTPHIFIADLSMCNAQSNIKEEPSNPTTERNGDYYH